MADETTTGTPPKPAGETPPEQGESTTTPGPVPYERFKAVNDRLKTLESQMAAIDQARQQQEEAEAKKRGDFEKLLGDREKELAAAKQQNARLRVAIEKSLPADLIDRLQGETTEDLASDADKLLALIKPGGTGSPGVPPPSTSGRTPPGQLPDFSTMTPEEIRKWSENNTLFG